MHDNQRIQLQAGLALLFSLLAAVPTFAGGEQEQQAGSLEVVTFTLMIPWEGRNPQEMALFQMLEEITNVRVEWQTFPFSVATEKKNLVYASGDYPDAMGGWFLGTNDILTYGPQGVFIPVEELIEEYAPNMISFFQERPDVKQDLITPDGHIYSFPLVAGPDTVTKSVTFINRTWLQQLGLASPTTTDEFYRVLKAFKDNDPNGNGKADEIPWSFKYDHPNQWHANHLGSFGMVYNQQYLMMKEGKVIFVPTSPEYREGVGWFNKLYREGLIDPEAFTHDNSQYVAKGRQEPIIIGVGCHWTGPHLVGMERYQEHYELLLPLKGPQGHQIYGEGDHNVFRTQFAITSSARRPEAIVKWLNAIFEPEMSLQINSGPLGVTIEKRADGTYHNIPSPEGRTFDELRHTHSVPHLPYGLRQDILSKRQSPPIKLLKEEADEAYRPYAVKGWYPPVWFTLEEQEILNVIQTEIQKFVGDNQARWIVGDGSIEAEWDSYLEELQKMGLDKLIKIYQDAADRYYAAAK